VKASGTIRQKNGKKVYLVNDVEVTKEEFDKAFPSKLDELFAGGVEVNTNCLPACWPMKSMAMGVHPKQVAAENARLAQAGCKAYHQKNGKLVIPDRAARSQAMRLKGMRDHNAFN
jgi:hypothetical protein